MNTIFSESEIAAAERLSMPVEEVRRVLDVYMEETARISRERRDLRIRDFAAENPHP